MKSNIKLYELKKLQSDLPKVKIISSDQSSKFIRQFYGDDMEVFESFFILLLNRAGTTLGYAKISQGGICATIVDPLIVAKYAIDSLAKSVILAHNHPSGNLKPSRQDEEITQKLKQGLKLFDVAVLDHIILTADGYLSFADEGII